MYNELLKKLGLSEKEAKIYLAVLELGPSTAQKIARKAGITRTTSYLPIKSLIKRGLITNGVRDKKTYLAAEAPENLSTLINVRKKETSKLCSELQKITPKLRLLFETTEERPQITFFEGKDGLKKMVNDFMKSKFSSVEEFTSLDEAYDFSPPQKNGYRRKVKSKFRKVPMRIIYTSRRGYKLKPKDKLRERRFLPPEKFPFTGSVTIYGEKVSLVSHKKTVLGLIVKSKELANILRIMFNLAWDAASKYQG